MADNLTSLGLVIGTAGHIDHGKTTLVGALTGMDTDRLAEEKRRGISIDLGFAHVTLPGGQKLSFVDVPGHERFIRNMLAGAAGIEAVLLVIAADESVKPQTREHFDICKLLDIRHGLIVLTKCDLAAPGQIEKAIGDARRLTAGSFLNHAPIVQVSAVSGAGLPELRERLAGIAAHTSRRDTKGLARLPIDRGFALKGFGTVVTGTLWSGRLRVGETVRIHPTNAEARIRGLQRHGEAVETAGAGDRTAVNLAGIDHAAIKRGFTLTAPNALETTTLLDAELDWLDPAAAPKKAAEFLLDIGTAEVAVTLRPLRENAAFARAHLAEPVLALPGDRFVLRRPSPTLTVAGGTVVDPFPPRRLNRAKTFERLSKLAVASPGERAEFLVEESANGLSRTQLVKLTGADAESANLLLVNGQHWVSKAWVERRRRKLEEWLGEFHAKNPALAGAPISQARLGIDSALLGPVFEGFAAIRLSGDIVALADHRPQVPNINVKALAQIENAFLQGGFQPPAPNGVLAASGIDAKTARGLLEALLKQGKLTRVAPEIIFHASVISHIRQSLAAHKGRRFSVTDFKTWTGVSRKYAIPLLEHLDQQRATKREGDDRVVL